MTQPDSFADVRRILHNLDTTPVGDLQRGVWIHGAGGFGRILARLLSEAGVTVLGFIDRLGVGLGRVDGHRVLHPDAISHGDIERTYHVHGLMNHSTASGEITRWAAQRGFAGLLFPTDLNQIPGVTLHHYWLAPSEITFAQLDALESVHDVLYDEESRRLLRTLLRYRMRADPREEPGADVGCAYMPDFLPIFDGPITFVDGGAYTGDTLDAMIERGINFDEWIAFEPDRANFARVRGTAHRHRERLGSYSLFQAGLSDRNERVAFSDGEGAASHLRADDPSSVAHASIEVVRMDDVVARKGPVYIKLDIEGAELSALRGMQNILTNGTTLAISIYHRPADLWEIPLFLIKRFPSAQFRLRQHGHHGFDTVLYMVPG